MSTNRAYSNELRADSSVIIIPIVSAIYVTVSLIRLANFVRLGADQLWPYIVITILSPIAGYVAWKFVNQNRNLLGTAVFLFVHMLMLSLIYYLNWHAGSSIPYFFLRRVTIIESVRGLLRVLYPRVGCPQGVTGLRPPEVRPSPPPCGWSIGFITTPRTEGRRPR